MSSACRDIPPFPTPTFSSKGSETRTSQLRLELRKKSSDWMLRETRDYLQKKPEDFRQRKPKRKQLFKRVGNEPLAFIYLFTYFSFKTSPSESSFFSGNKLFFMREWLEVDCQIT